MDERKRSEMVKGPIENIKLELDSFETSSHYRLCANVHLPTRSHGCLGLRSLVRSW